MKTLRIIVSLCASALIFACSSSGPVVVNEDLYADFDLSSYQTFDFHDIDAENRGKEEFQANMDYLQEAIVKKLTERGLTQSSSNPDLTINLGLTVEEKVQTRETNLATDPFMYTGQRNYTWQVQDVPVGTYEEGTLVMHLIDPDQKEAVWIGTIARALPNKGKNAPATIDNAVDLLFKQLDK